MLLILNQTHREDLLCLEWNFHWHLHTSGAYSSQKLESDNIEIILIVFRWRLDQSIKIVWIRLKYFHTKLFKLDINFPIILVLKTPNFTEFAALKKCVIGVQLSILIEISASQYLLRLLSLHLFIKFTPSTNTDDFFSMSFIYAEKKNGKFSSVIEWSYLFAKHTLKAIYSKN